MKLLELYTEAERRSIDVDWFPLCRASSLSVLLPDGQYCIALDPCKFGSLSDECVHLAHELGHCITGSFYNPHSLLDIRQKHENHADKWAIRYLIDHEDYIAAVASGEDIPALADRFGVTETFMKKAACFYTYGNLAVDSYSL